MCMNFMEHQSIDLVFNIVSNVLRVFPGRSVKNSRIACDACTWTQDDVSLSLFLFLSCSHFLCLETIV